MSVERRIRVYAIGDKIVYPMYGAGTIENFERKVIDGEEETYYVIRMPIGNLTIMISTRKADNIGIRGICDSKEIMKKIKQISKKPDSVNQNWNQRFKDNMEKIKTGDLTLIAEVVRNLMIREKEKGLSAAEKKLLMSAKQIILSELVLSKDINKEEAELMLAKELLS